MHDNSNNLNLAYHSVKKGLYTWHSNVHTISVDFFGSLANGGHGPMPPPPGYARVAGGVPEINLLCTFNFKFTRAL